MPFSIHVSQCVHLQKHLESCLEQVLAGVPDTVFGGNAADNDFGNIQQFKHFRKRLSCTVAALKPGVLLAIAVAALVKGKFLACIRAEFLVDFPAALSGYAMYRPNASVLLE